MRQHAAEDHPLQVPLNQWLLEGGLVRMVSAPPLVQPIANSKQNTEVECKHRLIRLSFSSGEWADNNNKMRPCRYHLWVLLHPLRV